ncbi:MAG: hypothetical protein AAFS11_01285 [Planctomycetota bacterium]
MTSKALMLIASAGAASAHAQDLMICVLPHGSGTWTIEAEFRSTPPSDIVQIWADASFRLSSNGSPMTITSYNPAYDTSLGQARITGNGTDVVEFVGNASSFFGTPDPSNPLVVATIETEGFPQIELFGQNSAIFELQPFGDVRLYMDAQGNAGELTFSTFWFPSPGSAAAFGALGLIAARRQRR